ncbi:MAG: RNA polymerase sigma factor [Candidatus Methylacidiphilales bacterium]|nr:RNA polymerase sigma factor [Candidatus Methylacidiphilales bacterium]
MDDPSPDLRPWVDAFCNGDENAARFLVDALYPDVLRIIRRRLPRQESEEDLAQEIFMKVFHKIDQYRGDQPFQHWVARLSLTTCLDRLRHHQRRPLLRWGDLDADQQQAFEETRMGDHAPDAAGQASARDLVDHLLGQLNPNEQLVLRMLDLEQLTVETISQQTGWGASKVKVTAFRARAKLRKLFQLLEKSHE